MTYPAYSEYKDSGVEWLGEVPEHWRVGMLSSFSTKITNGYVGPTRGLFVEKKNGIRYLQSLHIKNNKIDFHKPYYVTEEWSHSKEKSILKKGDVLVVQTGDIGQVASVPKEYEGCNCHALIIVATTKQLEGYFLSWVLNSSYGFHSLKSIQTGALHPHLNCDFVKTIKIPTPTTNEQTTIANFLDRETTKIDTLISKQQKLISLLQEKRQAVISHAVTKGINPDAKMKDSGVEWLGEVPEHWEAKRLKWVSDKIMTGGTPNSKSAFEDGTIDWFTPGDFQSDLTLSDSAKKITEEIYNSGEAKIFPPNTVMVVGIGATLGKVGMTSSRSSANQQINIIIPNKYTDGDFLTFSLSVKQDAMKQLSNSATIGIMNQEKTKQIFITVPPIEEQTAIANFLDRETTKIDILITKANKAIKLLQERRTALISAAVTGKIDVRNA